MVKRGDLLQKHFDWFYDRLEGDLEWYEQSFWVKQPRRNGVYVIYLYTDTNNLRVLYVGQGNFRERINRAHQKAESRTMNAVPNVQDKWRLCVARAYVRTKRTRKGIERYLAEELYPEAGERWDNVVPIRVNQPPLRFRW